MFTYLPANIPAMYDRGQRSPDAEILPRRGTSGTISCFSRLASASSTSSLTAEWPLSKELHRTSIVARTQDAGIDRIASSFAFGTASSHPCLAGTSRIFGTGRMALSCICSKASCSLVGSIVDVSALPPKPVFTPVYTMRVCYKH